MDFAQKILVDRLDKITLIGDGRQIRCFTWVGDVSRCISDNLFKDFTSCEIFNIGQTIPLEMRDLALIIAEYGIERGIIKQIPELISGIKPKYDIGYRVPSVEKINRYISTSNFKIPKVSIIDYLNESLIINKSGDVSWKE